MAAAAVSALPFDIRRQAAHTLRLGASVLQPSTASVYTSVRYNHKPAISDPTDSTCSIVPGSTDQGTILSLKDGDEEYTYSGVQAADKDNYVLIWDDVKQDLVLEKLDAVHSFNLTSAPWEEDQEKLAQQYPQLGSEIDRSRTSTQDEDLFGQNSDSDEDSEDDAPDPKNPFDFRHYLNMATNGNDTSPEFQEATVADKSTMSRTGTAHNTPTSRPSKRPTSVFMSSKAKPKTAVRDRPQPQQPTKPATGRANKNDKAIPSVRLDRAATTNLKSDYASSKRKKPSHPAPDELLDDGELVIEGDAHPKKHTKRSLGLALSGQLSTGPISLRSAASSPASRINTPPQLGTLGRTPLGASSTTTTPDDEETGFELGGSDDDADTEDEGDGLVSPDLSPASGKGLADADADAEGSLDGDVEDFALGSPAAVHRPSVSQAQVTNEDDDDDLEAQMLMAMEEVDGNEAGAAGVESDESEEE
ncbi:hypothetical protein LTR28_003818 [Elasticomyces elasticus]|nr:hypothetical protein LTR28_003818 [Elasticomyces elasticus]